MNKFKKILGMALIAIMIMMPVFGANNTSDTLLMTTKVGGVYQIGVFLTDPAGGSNASFSIPINAVATEILQATGSSDDIWVGVRTNQRTNVKVAVNAKGLIGTTSNILPYSIVFAAAANANISTGGILVNTASGHETHTITVNSSAIKGTNIFSYMFNINILSEDYDDAVSETYTGSIEFKLTVE